MGTIEMVNVLSLHYDYFFFGGPLEGGSAVVLCDFAKGFGLLGRAGFRAVKFEQQVGLFGQNPGQTRHTIGCRIAVACGPGHTQRCSNKGAHRR